MRAVGLAPFLECRMDEPPEDRERGNEADNEQEAWADHRNRPKDEDMACKDRLQPVHSLAITEDKHRHSGEGRRPPEDDSGSVVLRESDLENAVLEPEALASEIRQGWAEEE